MKSSPPPKFGGCGFSGILPLLHQSLDMWGLCNVRACCKAKPTVKGLRPRLSKIVPLADRLLSFRELHFVGLLLQSCQGAKVTRESFAPPKPSFAPVRNGVAPVQEAFCSLGPQDLLHPLLTTFGDFLFSGSFPAPWLPKFFSLRSCRSSSVIFFDFSQGNLENLVGNLEGIFRDFF